MYDCICIGSATQDVFVLSRGAQIHRLQQTEREQSYLAFEYGSKVMVEELFITAGGGAVNTSTGLAQLGLRSAIVCEVGQDSPAAMIREALQGGGVDVSLMVINSCLHTGYSVILTGFDGDRTVLVHRGAARDLTCEEVPWPLLTNSQWLFLGAMAGESVLIWDEMANFVSQHEVKLAINPGSQQIELGLIGLQPILSVTSALFVNREEGYEIVRRQPTHQREADFEVLRELQGTGCKYVFMTDGPRGACGFDGQQIVQVPAATAEPVSTLGAGDAFASGCVAALWRERGLAEAMQAGTLNAGGVVREMGGTVGLLQWDELSDRLGEIPAEII